MSKKPQHVTNFSYLDVKHVQFMPTPLKKLMDAFLGKASGPLVKLLGPFLGFGLAKDGVARHVEYMLKLSDGTKLATDVYVPKKVFKRHGKAPTILVRLPYWKDSLAILGFAFASYGYVTILQDTRGCAHSEGFNFFLQTERNDGLETLKWITKQYWYNGKIGMAGGSYFGLTQLVVSWDNGGLLNCIAPAVCSYSNLWNDHNGLKIHGLTTAIYRIMINIVSYYDDPPLRVITKEIEELFLNPRYALYNEPLVKKGKYLKFSDFIGKSVEECVEVLAKFYKIRPWDLSKRNFKVYFKFLEDFLQLEKDIENMPGLLEADFSKYSQPAFFLAGWYDMFIEHILKDFAKFQKEAPKDIVKSSKLVIGAWAHADKGHPVGSLIDFLKKFLAKGWQDYWLKDKKDAYPEIDKPVVNYYVINKDTWRYSDQWPPGDTNDKEFYIHSAGRANSVNGTGIIDSKLPGEEKEDSYRFNPLNPVITKGGRNLDLLKGAQNQKKAEKRNDVLVYTSKPLARGLEITGTFKMCLFAASSAKDTDFMVKLVEVSPRGKALNIIDGGIRARFRNGNANPSLIEPGKVVKYEFDVGNISYFIRPNHSLRLEITSSNFPRYDINSNLAGEKEGHAIADQQIFHDADHPTHLILPIHE